ncbi:hemicentin-1 isoform X3 [Danio aesculapii]|uniref:hemicentin-1 isoform X3 n=1 Tax=Danio aesculapii TaxID=1142201 RepID=UPI0024BF16C1|nr:hemicentin-1 isoform X3 [Danio aesculapii]
MTGFCIDVWLILFAVSARITEVKLETMLKRGLYSRVELTGETLAQQYTDSLSSVEWTKTNNSSTCLCFKKHSNNDTHYRQCCGKAHFYISNNSLILENVTKQDEGFYMETIVIKDKPTEHQNFTLLIDYPPKATEIQVSWSSSTSVSLACNVTGSFLHLMWKKEGVSIVEDERHSFSNRNQTLHISNISSSDNSTYSCIVSNEYGQSEKHRCITRQRGQTTTDEGDADNDTAIYQEVADNEKVIPLPCVYTDFIKPKESRQDFAAQQQLDEFGYSEVGATATVMEKTGV